MQAIMLADRYFRARYAVFKWRYNLAVTKKVALSFMMAGLVAVLAQMKIQLPWTPVPITGSTFGAIFAGVFLGNLWGGVSMLIYIAMGVAGLPVFAGYKSGLMALFGPTGGYLVGFFLAALFIGYITDNYFKARKFLPLFGIMLFSSVVIVYLPGMLNLALWLNMAQGRSVGFGEILWMGAVPFIPGDIIKSFIAALIADLITPKESYK